MAFLNLRIRGRLYGGFGALLLFCAALAGFAVWQLWGIDTQVTSMTLQSKNTIRAGEIATELQAIRRGILRYAFDHDEASFAEAEKRLAKYPDLLEEADRTTPSEERRAAYKRSQGDRRTEGQARCARRGRQADAGRPQPAVHRRRQDGGRRAEIRRRSGKDANSRTKLSALETKVLLVRVANWRMLATRDPKGIATFKTNVEKAQQQIAELEKADLPPNLAALLADGQGGCRRNMPRHSRRPDPTWCSEMSSTTRAITPLTIERHRKNRTA